MWMMDRGRVDSNRPLTVVWGVGSLGVGSLGRACNQREVAADRSSAGGLNHGIYTLLSSGRVENITIALDIVSKMLSGRCQPVAPVICGRPARARKSGLDVSADVGEDATSLARSH